MPVRLLPSRLGMASKPSDINPRVVVYLSLDEHAKLKVEAKRRHMKLGTWMRVALLEILDQQAAMAQPVQKAQ